jgi:hypothetical protein
MKYLILVIAICSFNLFAYETPFKRSGRIKVTCSSGAKIMAAKSKTSYFSSYAKKCRISNWSCYPLYKVETGLPDADKKGLSDYAVSKLEKDCKGDSDAMSEFLYGSERYCSGYDSNAWFQTKYRAHGRLTYKNHSKRLYVQTKYKYNSWKNKAAGALTATERKQLVDYQSAIAALNSKLKKSYNADLLAMKKKYHGPYLKAQCCAGSQCKPI